MDNRKIDVTSVGRETLAKVLALFEQHHAVGYNIRDGRFIAYWSDTSVEEITRFPFKMQMPQLADFIWQWLGESAAYGPEPDHDGHNKKGWRCYCEGWGHVGDQWQAFAAVAPTWAMYGK